MEEGQAQEMTTNNPDYMRQWRKNNPDKVKRNRQRYKNTDRYRQHAREYYADNREAKRVYAKAYRLAHKAQIKASKIKHLYGELDYNLIFEEQNGCCAICGRHQSQLSQSLCVDHDHKTGEIRGLLCSDCNLGLGCFQDSAVNLKYALSYTQRWKKGGKKKK